MTAAALRVGALFAGYGGVELAVHEVLGTEPAWFSEFDAAPSKVLAHHWPGVPNLGDITRVRWTPECPTCGAFTHVRWFAGSPADYECPGCGERHPLTLREQQERETGLPIASPVFILTGGFPCQDVSHAGKRAGLKDGTRSGLWARMCDAIAALRPRLVVAENVRGLLSAEGEEPTDAIRRLEARRDHLSRSLRLVERKLERAIEEEKTTHAAYHRRDAVRLARLLKRAVGAVRRERAGLVRAIGTVLRDLADLGYDAAWCGLRAADVGAPHARFRVFIVAWPADADGARLEVDGALAGASSLAGAGLDRPPADDLTLLPTPVVNDMGDGKSLEWWDEWAPRQKASDGRPAPHGTTLAIEALRLLPTPEAKLGSSGADYARESRPGTGGDSLHEAVGRLFPTPRATDGTKGGPNQRGSSGDLMLPSAVTLLPTPTTANASGNGQNNRGDVLLPGALLPTPTTDPATGNGHARNLGHEAGALLPTPTAMDAEASGGVATSPNVTLTDATVRGRGLMPTPSVADVEGGRKARSGSRSGELLLNGLAAEQQFGQYAAAIARWEPVVGRPAPAPTEPTGRAGAHRLSPAFVEWMMGLPAGWVTDVPGLTRNEALKMLGNGVVPQQAAAALGHLLGVALRAQQSGAAA